MIQPIINLAVGTRALSTQVPVAYELPPEVVREAIVNAVAHRNNTSNGSVQVMLFADRLEVWNPGTLPPPLTLEKLRHPHGSVPVNPLLAEPHPCSPMSSVVKPLSHAFSPTPQ